MSSLEQNLSTLALMNITECLKRRKTCDRTCDEGCRFYVGEDARNRALSKAISLLNAECVQERLAEGSSTATAGLCRPSKAAYYLMVAEVISKRSTCLRRQYGAVIVKNDVIIATGYNGSPRGDANCCDTGVCHRVGMQHNDGNYGECPAVHAEMNALLSVGRELLIGSTLYLWGQDANGPVDAVPCPVCERLLRNAGVSFIVSSSASGVVGEEREI